MKFKSIKSEQYRTYIFPKGEAVTIHNPQEIHVSESGGHRIVDGNGFSHYIPSGWIHLFWEVKKGEPHFVM